jgi:hypothetical protein
MLRSYRSHYDHGGEAAGQGYNPFVTVEPAEDVRAENQRNRQAQTGSDVQPEQRVALRGRDLRALYRRMVETEALENPRQSVERRDHCEKTEISRRKQPGQNDDGAELHYQFGDLSEARNKGPLHDRLSERVHGFIRRGAARDYGRHSLSGGATPPARARPIDRDKLVVLRPRHKAVCAGQSNEPRSAATIRMVEWLNVSSLLRKQARCEHAVRGGLRLQSRRAVMWPWKWDRWLS